MMPVDIHWSPTIFSNSRISYLYFQSTEKWVRANNESVWGVQVYVLVKILQSSDTDTKFASLIRTFKKHLK
jgi:hypothetical protein